MNKIKFGVLRETKNPPDRRTALAPNEAISFQRKFPHVELVVQSSELRAYTDKEYTDAGITIVDDISDCDVLIGVKEVKLDALIPNKTYIFFSHTAKKQNYNKELLQTLLEKNIRLIDYEYLTNMQGQRLVAFGRWAGIVGAYNALYGYGQQSGTYKLKRAHECYDIAEVHQELKKVKLPADYRIVITGGGRVAHGSMEMLDSVGIKKVTPQQLLESTFDEPVYAQVDPWHYTKRKNGDLFDLEHFFKHPSEYKSAFLPYTKNADMYITGHFWSKGSPIFIQLEDMQAPDFRMKHIADISCDIDGPISSTVRASTIEKPFYGFAPTNAREVDPFPEKGITVMAVDNLPGEAPRSASVDFGKDLIKNVFRPLFDQDVDGVIERATITKDGELMPDFAYLQNWVNDKE